MSMSEFDIVIRQRNGKVVAGMPQIPLYAKGDDIISAVERLEAKKKEIEADLADMDITPLRNTAVGIDRGSTLRHLGLFAAKTLIAVAIIAASVGISGVAVINSIQTAYEKNAKIGGTAFWRRVEDQLDQLAGSNSDLSPDKKQKLLADIRTIGDRWRPFVVEIANVFKPGPVRSP